MSEFPINDTIPGNSEHDQKSMIFDKRNQTQRTQIIASGKRGVRNHQSIIQYWWFSEHAQNFPVLISSDGKF